MSIAAVGYIAMPHAPDDLALYQRASALHEACKAAGAAILALPKGQSTTFLDNCATPIVTRISNPRGHLIVTRIVETPSDAGKRQLATYSVLVDGDSVDKWRVLEVRRAPNKLTLDASLLTTNVAPNEAAVPRQAQQ